MTEVTKKFSSNNGTGVFDEKDREIGFEMGLSDDGVKFYGWVQNQRLVKGVWKDFGVFQRSKEFSSPALAKAYALKALHERIAKVKEKDAKEAAYRMARWVPEEQDAWKAADDAVIAAHKAKNNQ